MNIVSFVDKDGSAIDRLARMNAQRFPHLNVNVLDFHPKRPDAIQMEDARKAIEWADIIDFQYWKTAVAIRNLFPKECEGKKTILTHQNEHNIDGDWEWKKMKWDAIIAKNGWQADHLSKQGYKPIFIRHAVEFNNLRFTDYLPEEKVVLYVGQIKKVKGVREIAQACEELSYRFHIIGNPSEQGYFQELMAKYSKVITLGNNIPDDQMLAIYANARVYCANSDDGTESGTMPILEAMASGIPVVTRNIGHVRDMGEHMKNMYIRKGVYTDIEDLKTALKLVMENDDIANELRENAWRTVRQYHPDIQAREYEKVFRQVMFPGRPIVSVIIPTCNRWGVLMDNIGALEDQTYKNFEVVVCDDSVAKEQANIIETEQRQKRFSFPVRYLWTGKENEKEYGLAKARNLSVVESIGEILIFCDDRLRMHPSAIEGFVKMLQSFDKTKKVWLWGSKGQFKSFVENFSATWRRSLIDGGMFNERIDEYGGMTQEISGRFGSQGFRFEWCPQSLAEPTVGTHSKSHHREEIIRSKIKLYKMGFQ